MAKKKKRRGHYCHVCGNYLSNEKFSGKGHSKHICKKCSSIPKKEQIELNEIDKIYSLFAFSNLSKQNRLYLEQLSINNDFKISNAANGMLKYFSKEYNKIIGTKEEDNFMKKYFPDLFQENNLIDTDLKVQ